MYISSHGCLRSCIVEPQRSWQNLFDTALGTVENCPKTNFYVSAPPETPPSSAGHFLKNSQNRDFYEFERD